MLNFDLYSQRIYSWWWTYLVLGTWRWIIKLIHSNVGSPLCRQMNDESKERSSCKGTPCSTVLHTVLKRLSRDSNPVPLDYESDALTTRLCASNVSVVQLHSPGVTACQLAHRESIFSLNKRWFSTFQNRTTCFRRHPSNEKKLSFRYCYFKWVLTSGNVKYIVVDTSHRSVKPDSMAIKSFSCLLRYWQQSWILLELSMWWIFIRHRLFCHTRRKGLIYLRNVWLIAEWVWRRNHLSPKSHAAHS